MVKIEIYTTPHCPFCVRAKDFLKKKGLEFTEFDVMADPDRRLEMKARAPGSRTVPQIFINGKSIGGCDDMLALDSAGDFDKILA